MCVLPLQTSKTFLYANSTGYNYAPLTNIIIRMQPVPHNFIYHFDQILSKMLLKKKTVRHKTRSVIAESSY